MLPIEKRFSETLIHNGVRCTSARRAVFKALQASDEPLPLQAVITKTKDADRASVYRALARFEQLRIINVILVGWKKHFELAAPYKSHHHHIHCEQCSTVTSIESPTLEKLIKTISEQKGFHLHRHTLELSGCCDTCKELESDKP